MLVVSTHPRHIPIALGGFLGTVAIALFTGGAPRALLTQYVERHLPVPRIAGAPTSVRPLWALFAAPAATALHSVFATEKRDFVPGRETASFRGSAEGKK